ncbi:MAG: hypothetical protein ACI94Y_001642 [Maribacter sp.]|jgi:hypothetical protein
MRAFFVIMLSFVFAGVFAQADSVRVEQTPLTIAEDSLKGWAKTFMTNRDVDVRTEAADKFVEGLYAALETPASFDYKFDSLFTVSQLYPADSTFRIMTWQLYIDKDEYKYFGIIQQRGDKEKNISPKITRLNDFSGRMKNIEDKVLSAENWYGVLYYNIEPFKTKKGMKYALFGFDAYKFFEKRKLMEILSFDENREPIFGAPVIEYTIKRNNVPAKEAMFHRFMIEYSANASASINFNLDEEMILFDHLIPMSSSFPDVPYVMVPDGSYEGFKMKRGVWTYVEKVYDQISDEAPRPSPVFDGKKRDILGRPQK